MSDTKAAGHSSAPSPLTRQARRRSGLRKTSAGISVMLLVQYGLGMGVNLYARVPAADQGAGLATALGRALTSQPVVLAVHGALGLLLLVAGLNVLVRAILARNRRTIATSAAGLAAIVAAAVSGAAFVNSGQAGSSMAMAIVTGVALLCYLANLLVAAALRLSLLHGRGEWVHSVDQQRQRAVHSPPCGLAFVGDPEAAHHRIRAPGRRPARRMVRIHHDISALAHIPRR